MLLVTVLNEPIPRVRSAERVQIEAIPELGFYRVRIHVGFMETPHVPKALIACKKYGLKFDMMSTSFFLSRRHLKASGKLGMPLWQDYLFIGMAVNANSASDYFHLPTGRVVEVGTQVTI